MIKLLVFLSGWWVLSFYAGLDIRCTRAVVLFGCTKRRPCSESSLREVFSYLALNNQAEVKCSWNSSLIFLNVFKCIHPNGDHVSITVMRSCLEKRPQGCLSERLLTLRAGRLPDGRGSCSAFRLGILNSLLKASTYKAFLTSKYEYIVSLH